VLTQYIDNDYEALFCDKNGMCKFNMYKIFSKTGRPQEMSVGMFARIMSAFGVKELEEVTSSQLSLRTYLEIDNNAILKGIMAIKFS